MHRLRLGAVLTIALFLSACGDDDPSDPTGGDQPTAQFECEELGYPCSLADTPTERLESAVALLEDALDQLDQGSMADARAWLEAQPEVIEVQGDDRTLRFRIENCPPVWLADVSQPDEGGAAPAAGGDKSIIGEDTDRSGAIDNRDDKRALVLAPYFWQFQPEDESDLLQGQLQSLRGYEGNVTYKRNLDEGDQNLTLDDYFGWNDRDLVYLATHGARISYGQPTITQIVISTGVVWDFANQTNFTLPGVVLVGAYGGGQSNRILELGLTHEFFRSAYPDGLDDTVVVLAACETGGVLGNILAEGMAGDDFVMFGWTEVVDSPDAFAAASLLMEMLGEGLTTSAALQAVDDAGLRSVLNSDLVTTEFERFAPDGGDLRLYELPQLLDLDGEVLQDGEDVSDLVLGAVGDGDPDALFLVTELDGVRESDRGQFTLRYRLGGNDLPGSYGLGEAIQTGNYRYRVGHEVDLGFDAAAGADIPLEVVVDLPEGGESRFRVDVNLTEGGGGGSGETECVPYQPTPAPGGKSGQWEEPEGVDGYAYSVPSSDRGGGVVRVTLSAGHPDIIPWLEVRASGDDNGTVVVANAAGTNDEGEAVAYFEGKAGQSYTITCRQFGNAPEDMYPISFSSVASFQSKVDCWEPNDYPDDAKLIALDDPVSAYMIAGHAFNAVTPVEYDDWYRVEIPESGHLVIDVTVPAGDHIMKVLIEDLDGNQILAGGVPQQPGVPFTVTTNNPLAPGTYRVLVGAAVPDVAMINGDQDPPRHWSQQYIFTASLER
jgi:hypothetical protein